MTSYNVLLVDDELHALRALVRTLRDDYDVFAVTSGKDALSVMERNEIALIITDQRMPDMTGIELLAEIRHKHPDTVRMILTAYSATDKNLLVDAINLGNVFRYLTKPWEPEEIRAFVKEGIEVYEASQLAEPVKRRIGEILVDNDVVSEAQLQDALEMQKHDKRRLGEILVDLGYASEESICFCYAVQLGLPYMPISQFSIEGKLIELLPSDLARKHAVMPVNAIGKVLTVATSEPLTDRARSDIERRTGYRVATVCSLFRDIEAALKQYYNDQELAEDTESSF